ncbi:MAG: cobalt ECF transporter T component CbiQ [Candidatus Omnitrophota bacterium]|jgi:cobalt/nickel transport system permease protein
MARLGRNKGFIEHSAMDALSFMKDSLLADEYALKKGFLQSLDARVKAATFIFIILQVILARKMVVLLPLYAFSLVLAGISNIRLGFFIKRTWIFMPLFSLFIALPALFSFFTPGDPLVAFGVAGLKLTVTRQGASTVALFVTRVVTCVSYVVLLSITTRHFELLKVLRIFKIPQVFVMTLGISYRYIYLFIGIIENTYLAIKSRVGTRVRYKKGQHIVAWNIGSLWQRSYKLNDDVYKAMLSRGYSGEPVILEEFRIRPRDWLWLFGITVISVLLFILRR